MANKTGRYRYNKETGEMEKISDAIPNVCVFDCHVPEGGYWSENLARKPGEKVFIESRSEKRRLLRERGLREVGDKLSTTEV